MQSPLEDRSVIVEAASDAGTGRRSPRIHAEFWVRILGLEPRPRRRPGDLSSTGIFVNTDAAIGSPGDLVELEISSVDQACTVATPARICRVIRQDDVDQGAAIIGAGFEFLQAQGIRPKLVALLNHVASHELLTFGNVRLDSPLPAFVRLSGGSTVGATVKTLGSELILLKVNQKLPARGSVDLEIPYGESDVATLQGRVLRCTPQYAQGDETQYGLLVQRQPLPTLSETQDDPLQGDVISDIVSSLVVPADVQPTFRGGDLLGQLSHVRVTSLLSLLETEQLTGTLTIANAEDCIVIEVDEGKVVSVNSTTPGTAPEQALAALQAWPDGDFKFRSKSRASGTGLRVAIAH